MQPFACSRCHNLVMVFKNLSDIALLNTKNADYCCIITGISNSKAIKLLQKLNLTEKGTLLIKRAIWSYNFTRNS